MIGKAWIHLFCDLFLFLGLNNNFLALLSIEISLVSSVASTTSPVFLDLRTCRRLVNRRAVESGTIAITFKRVTFLAINELLLTCDAPFICKEFIFITLQLLGFNIDIFDKIFNGHFSSYLRFASYLRFVLTCLIFFLTDFGRFNFCQFRNYNTYTSYNREYKCYFDELSKLSWNFIIFGFILLLV